MKKTILNTLLIIVIVFLNACSTPEERASVVEGVDSVNTPASAPSDSLNSSLKKMNGDMDTASNGDTPSQKKMESFRHTPIDTITNLSDTTKNK